MALIDELHALQDRLTDLSRYEKIILDLALVLAEDLHEIVTGSLPERTTKLSTEDYLENRIPDTFELVDGRPRPKHWKAYSEASKTIR